MSAPGAFFQDCANTLELSFQVIFFLPKEHGRKVKPLPSVKGEDETIAPQIIYSNVEF